ncbi:MAG: pilus assembly PilX N-terminal domain-containing protein [Clostridia bacterium]|nr:pilus assembly PilX N-terminal domain-containing protein [Clostridia bacterium]
MFFGKMNNRGSTLATVLITLTVLIILGTALINSSLYSYKTSKFQQNIEFAHYAAQSGIEKAFDSIYRLCENPVFTNGVPRPTDMDFANNVIEKIKETLDTSYVNPGDPFKYTIPGGVEITDEGINADVSISDIRLINQSLVPPVNIKMNITIGIVANGYFKKGIYNSGIKPVYAQREFEVFLPTVFELNAPIYSLGDLVTMNGINAWIGGDVYVCGTSPEVPGQAEQFYYGGIYSRLNSRLTINGNVYCRSLIRTGKYDDIVAGAIIDDNSAIHITKDAIAQSIQAFGKNDRIVVHNNAYTYDDVEMNGEDSIIAINGSYFGISKGIVHHDDSSAIVNSAVVHYPGSAAAKRSRIVINGDVLINGGTFKFDTDLGAQGQIEDASIGWSPGTNQAMYKNFNWLGGTDYHSWLRANRSDVTGFGNLLQIWPKQTDIGAWLADIDNVRSPGDYNNITAIPTEITGYCNYEMAANDVLYFMDKSDISASEVKPLNNLAGYTIDNVSGVGSNYWDYTMWGGSYVNMVSEMLEQIGGHLLPLTEKFVKRDYKYSLGKILNKPAPATGNITGGDNLFTFLQGRLNNIFAPGSSYYVVNIDDTVGNTEHSENLGAILSGKDITKDYLIINNDPEVTLEISNSFNGIIFSMGRVLVRGGASIDGAIIASGRGYVNGSFNGSAAENIGTMPDIECRIPKISEDGTGINLMDNGDLAGICFEGSGTASVSFPGRVALFNRFSSQDTIFNALSSIL